MARDSWLDPGLFQRFGSQVWLGPFGWTLVFGPPQPFPGVGGEVAGGWVPGESWGGYSKTSVHPATRSQPNLGAELLNNMFFLFLHLITSLPDDQTSGDPPPRTGGARLISMGV